MTKTLPISEARENFRDLVEKAQRLRARFIITRNGKPDAVIIGHEEFESWLETLDVIASKEEVESIRKGLEDLKGGHSSSFEKVFGEPLRGQKPKDR